MPLITLFTAPKPFVDPHINITQRNTLRNWLALGDQVEVVVVGDDAGVAEVCSELGIPHLPDVRCNELGTPLISSIFELARGVNQSPFLLYSNADILFFPELVSVVGKLAQEKDQFLGVGQRWDLTVEKPIDFSVEWEVPLRNEVQAHARLHRRTGSDYFLYPRDCFQSIPDFTVGRAGWDNWMIYHARWQNWPVVDLTQVLTVVHQNHDYSHLPDGKRHYELPETALNIELAGGRHTIFTLDDFTHLMKNDSVTRKPLKWSSFWREVEIFPLIRLHSRFLWWISFSVFHPCQAFQRFKEWFVNKLKHAKQNDVSQ